MKKHLLSRSLLSLVAIALSASVMAQAPVRINKAAQLQQRAGKSVIVSTDSRLPRVLATFDQPTDINSLPQEVKDFLYNYEIALRQIAEGADPLTFLSVAYDNTGRPDSVGPVLKNIAFNQGYPYNNKCPILNGERAVTGCVATAMAMVMAHYKYPAVGVGEATYTAGKQGASVYKYADHPFDWNNMLDTYDGVSFSGKQADAVAELSLACGAGINMDYSASGSGTQAEYAKTALINHFGYNSKMGWGERPDDQDLLEWDWIPQLQDQFLANRPVIYAASGPGGINGHCFCLDGYVMRGENIYFHVNWGWGGSGNGWFMLTKLVHGGDNYNSNQRMIYDIYPQGTGVENVEGNKQTLDFSLPIYNILGTRVDASQLQHGQIYLQKGRKFIY